MAFNKEGQTLKARGVVGRRENVGWRLGAWVFEVADELPMAVSVISEAADTEVQPPNFTVLGEYSFGSR